MKLNNEKIKALSNLCKARVSVLESSYPSISNGNICNNASDLTELAKELDAELEDE